jgi:hypothetical protein
MWKVKSIECGCGKGCDVRCMTCECRVLTVETMAPGVLHTLTVADIQRAIDEQTCDGLARELDDPQYWPTEAD